MVEKWILVGFKKVNIIDNDKEASFYIQVFKRDFTQMPTEEDEEKACKEYNLDYVEKRLVNFSLFQ